MITAGEKLQRHLLRSWSWPTAILLGLLGFYLNLHPISLGWGLDILLGPAVVMSGVRVLRRGPGGVAAVVAASATVVLWHHPWAWLIWTAEVVVVSSWAHRSALVKNDAIFWVLLGGPMIALSYGLIMEMDARSVSLVLAKQSVNGLLCVALAEVIYGGCYLMARRLVRVPMISLEALALSSFVLVSVVPPLLFARMAAPEQEQLVRQVAAARAEVATTAASHIILETMETEYGVRADGRVEKYPSIFTLPTPFRLRLGDQLPSSIYGALFVLGPSREVLAINGGTIDPALAESLTADRRGAVLTTPAFGVPLMTSLRQAQYAQAVSLPFEPHARLAVAIPLGAEIGKVQIFQLRLLGTLAIVTVALTLVTMVFASQIRVSVSRLIHSAVGLTSPRRSDLDALLPAKTDFELFSELDDFARQIAAAEIRVADEQGQLRASQRRLRSIAANAPMAIYALDVLTDGVVSLAFASAGFNRIFGGGEAQRWDIAWWERSIHPADRARVARRNQQLIAGAFLSMEYRLKHFNGHYVWVLDSLSVESGEGGSREVVGVLIDISERKLAMESLAQADKMASLGRLASGVAHELSQPLHAMHMALANLRLRLQTGTVDSAHLRHKLDVIGRQIDRASTVIRHMQELNTLQRGDEPYVLIQTPMHTALQYLRPDFDAANIDVRFQNQANDACVAAGALALEQVFVNILLNARDAILEARADGRKSGCISIDLQPGPQQITINISDDGCGIPDAIAQKIFEPFFTTKPPQQAVGLGLTIAYGIVTDLGGQIVYRPGPAVSCFQITLPLVEGGENRVCAPRAGE